MPHISRFKLKESERDGFKHLEIELTKDGPWKVHPAEYDIPPPSKKSLGGEGDSSNSEARSNSDFTNIATDTLTPADVDNPVFYITAAGGIAPTFLHPFMRVAGSNNAITITANPRIVAGQEGNKLTLVGVGSGITIQNGNGIAMMGSLAFRINSGDSISFYYTSGGSVWNETSRLKGGGF